MFLRPIQVAIFSLVMIVGGTVYAEAPGSSKSPIWIALDQSRFRDKQPAKLEIQVPSGIDFKVIRAITEAVSDSGMEVERLVPRRNINLEFSTSSFLVIKLDGTELILAPGSSFPVETTRSLATGLNGIGLQNTTVVSPDELMQRRRKHGDPFFPAFAYQLRSASASESPVQPFD